MDRDQQETNESLIEHTLLSKQRDDKMDEEELWLKSPPSSDVIIIIDDEDKESTLEKPMLVSPRLNIDTFDELSIVVKGILETKENNDDVESRVDLYFSSTDLNEKKKEEKKKNNDVESSTSKKGYGHMSLDDLGVSVEDLKSIPWEAFDPTWEMRSWANDPWLYGDVDDLVSHRNDLDS